jgi:hypothetical protein
MLAAAAMSPFSGPPVGCEGHRRRAPLCGQWSTWRKSGWADEHHDGIVVVPRVGLDAGGDHLRVRLATEGRSYGAGGIGVSLGLAYRF